jgi:two-component system repressor protein LuxO
MANEAGGSILIVEDSPSLALTAKLHLEDIGHRLLMAETGQQAYDMLRSHPVVCVLLDLRLPDMDGIDILEDLRTWPSPPAVVVMTSNASLATAIRAVRGGAFDYLVKPFSQARLVTTVQNALANVALRQEVTTFRRTVPSGGFAGFVGRSLAMQAVYRTIEAAAPSSASVFITGESGTGKELAAEALHRFSRRAAKNFVALNCAAMPRDLIESVIFGHVKGSFTGAVADQEGAAARADGGTLFLDELGEMEIGLQTKLLRFIQTGSYERLGEGRLRQADIRFIAATNRPPEEAIREGRLREDLFYRLNVVPLALPPLRERGEDIVLIARRFLADFAAAEGKPFTGFSPEVEAWLLAQPWPGNVRQLQNVVRNIVVLQDGPVVTREMLPAAGGFTPAPQGIAMPARSEEIDTLAVMEQRYIEHVIGLCNGNLQLAARKLGISPSTIYRKKEAWGQSK